MVDVWHCDALRAYSGFQDNTEGFSTVGEDWLRGYQNTDASGRAEFTTIYPGWYRGRATHIHFKVSKDNMEFTSQWFFDDALSDEVHANETPYNEDGASGRLQNSEDNIYQESNGMLLLDVQPSDDGYAATFSIGIQIAFRAFRARRGARPCAPTAFLIRVMRGRARHEAPWGTRKGHPCVAEQTWSVGVAEIDQFRGQLCRDFRAPVSLARRAPSRCCGAPVRRSGRPRARTCCTAAISTAPR